MWEPILRLDSEAKVERACTRVPDQRARHFWDGNRALGRIFSPVLGLLGRPAWDVYLLYGPQAEWAEQSAPKPDFWMHQLSNQSDENRLDGDRFAQEVKKSLTR